MPGHYGKNPSAKKKVASKAAKLKAKNPKMPAKVAVAIAKNTMKKK